MTTLTVGFEDKVIIKDGDVLHFEGDTATANFNSVVSAQGDSGVWAIQWNGSTGEVESRNIDDAASVPTQEKIDAYVSAFDAEKERLKQKQKTDYLAQDAVLIAKAERGLRLQETDLEALSDRTMSEAMRAYRQALRDLPDSGDWNPLLTWDDVNWVGSLVGVVWPEKP